MTIRNVWMRRAAACVLSTATLAQAVEAIAPTALIARVLTGTIVGGIAGDLLSASNAYAGAAEDGQNFGGTLLGSSAGAVMQQGSAAGTQNFINGVGGYSSATMTSAQDSASIGNPTLKATGVADFSCAQQAALGVQGTDCPPLSPGQATTCQDPNQPAALQAMQTVATQALQQAYGVCHAVGAAINAGVAAYLPTLQTVTPPDVVDQTIARNLSISAQTLYTQVQSIESSLNSVISTYQTTPGCNVLSSSDVNSMAAAVTSASNTLQSACSSLSTTVNASTANSLLGQLTGINTSFMATANGNPTRTILSNIKAMNAYMAVTNNGQLTMQDMMGPYTQGGSTKLGANTGNPIINQLMDPANAGIVQTMTNIVQSTDPQNLVPAGNGLFNTCSGTSTKIQTTLGDNGKVSYTTVSDPVPVKNNPAGSVCVDSRASPAPGNGQWIYLPATQGQCNGTAASSAQISYSFQVPYTGGSGQLDLYVQAYTTAPSASVVIQPRGGTSVSFTVTPGAPAIGTPNSPNPPNVTVPATTASQAGMMTVDATINGAGEFWMSVDNGGTNFVGTSSQWYSMQAALNQAQKDTGYTPETTSSVGANSGASTVQPPSAVQNSVSCQAAMQCLGTQCHSILGTQDQSFSKAATGLATLQDIAQHACCANGTSLPAGNCQLAVFCGKPNTCRDFLLSGAGLTNDCCDNPVPSSPWATMLKIFTIAYAQGWVPSYSSSLMTSLPNWMESSYSNMSAWYNATTGEITSAANEFWSTVTGPFKSIAQSWSNAWGAGGPTSFKQVIDSLMHVSGTGTTPPSGTNAGGANYSVGTESGQTTPVNMVGGGGGMAPALQGVNTMASLLSGALQGVAEHVIETIAPQFSAAIESAAFGTATPAAIADGGGTTTVGGVATDVNNPSAYTNTASNSALGSGILGDIMLAYAIYQIASLVGHLLTRCTREEYTFYSNRHQRLCFSVGNYCSNSDFFGICLETTYVSCCYASMLDRIIMQQLLMLDPGAVPNSSTTQPYGTPQNPACAGLTPQALAQINQGGYFDKINYSEYVAYLISNNMLPTTNAQGSNYLTPQQNNNTGLVDTQGRPTTNQKIYQGQ